MIDPVNSDRRPPVSPQLAVRVAALGVVAFLLFAVIFFRLWYLQVLSGDQYLAQAQTNKVRVQPLPAPRGNIVDRRGNVIVRNRLAIVVKVKPESLPASEKTAAADYGQEVIERSKRPKGSKGAPVPIPPIPPDLDTRFRRLSVALATPTRSIQESVIRGLFLAGYAPVTVKTDVDPEVRTYIAERQEQFPGVSVDQAFLRDYPNKELAAQLLGTVGQISPEQLTNPAFKGVPAGSIVGQGGIEREYDNVLRGKDGIERLLVDAQGNPRGEGLRVEPKPGRNLQVSLSLNLQRAAQSAYESLSGGKPGAFVALDPRNGQVLAMGSFPTFDPSVLVGTVPQKRYDAIFNNPDVPAPQFNRAVDGGYATGSTFKPFTALAALASGATTTTKEVSDTGCITIGRNKEKRCNAGDTPYGMVDLRNALRVSSDIYFYRMGEWTNPQPNRPIQTWARKLGFERKTGIDLPAEATGLIPDAAWRKRVGKDEKDCRKKKHIPIDATGEVAAAGGCGISDMREWTVGDNVGLAIGQGDLKASPLQLAVAYAGLINDGRVPRPQLGMEIQDDNGQLAQRLPPSGGRHVKIDPSYRETIMEGLHDAASADGGTSTTVFDGWNQSGFPVFGKTGTAQYTYKDDQSWYVGYSYEGSPSKRPIVVVATVETGGFGAERAAPIVCRIMKAWFGGGNNKQAQCIPGEDTTR